MVHTQTSERKCKWQMGLVYEVYEAHIVSRSFSMGTNLGVSLMRRQNSAGLSELIIASSTGRGISVGAGWGKRECLKRGRGGVYHKRGVYHKGGEAVKLGNTPVPLLNTMLFPTVSKLTSDFNPNSTSVNLSWLLNERLTWVMVMYIHYILYSF